MFDVLCLGFGVWGSGLGVRGLGFGVQRLGFGIWGLGLRADTRYRTDLCQDLMLGFEGEDLG